MIIATPRLVKPLPHGRPVLPTDHFSVPTALEFFMLGSLEARNSSDAKVPETKGSAPAGDEGASGAASLDPLHDLSVAQDGGAFSGISDALAGAVGHILDLSRAEEELQ